MKRVIEAIPTPAARRLPSPSIARLEQHFSGVFPVVIPGAVQRFSGAPPVVIPGAVQSFSGAPQNRDPAST